MVHKPTRRTLPLVLLTLLLLSAVVVLPAAAEEPAPQRWVPIGASYEAEP